MTAPLMGETVALATSFLWAFTAIFFTFAGSRIGSFAVNRIRLLMAILFLSVTSWITQGTPFVSGASLNHWWWFGLSGFIGLTLGDGFLFQSFLDLGPRRAALVMSSWPIFSALLSYVILGQKLSLLEWLGIIITIFGIAWVILEKSVSSSKMPEGNFVKGVVFAFLGAFCQALGIVVAKNGLDGHISPLSGTMIRMIVAAVSIWIITLLMNRARESLSGLKDSRAMVMTTLGSIVGPFLGVWMSLVAVQYAKVGVASTLMALMPIILLPLGKVFFGDKITPRAVMGTLASFTGVAILLASG